MQPTMAPIICIPELPRGLRKVPAIECQQLHLWIPRQAQYMQHRILHIDGVRLSVPLSVRNQPGCGRAGETVVQVAQPHRHNAHLPSSITTWGLATSFLGHWFRGGDGP